MAYGPLFPSSIVPDTNSKITPGTHSASSNYREGHSVMATLDADTKLHLEFEIPPTLPTGTCKLVIIAVANATSGDAKFNPQWVSVDPGAGENAFTATRVAEGVSTLSWGTGDENDDKELKITMDADTVVAGETMVMTLLLPTSGYSLGAIMTFKVPWLIWE